MKEIELFNRVNSTDRAFVARQLATMLSSGLNLDKSISILVSQVKNKYFKRVLQAVLQDLEGGTSFSESLRKYPKAFDRIFVNVVVSGEAVGKLAEVLSRLAEQLEKENSFMSKIKGALYYPLFVVLVMLVIAGFMMVKVIPPLKDVFTEFNTQLPWATETLINLADFMVNYWSICIVILIGSILGIIYLIKTEKGKAVIDYTLVKYTGGLGVDVYMARFARTLGMLMQAGTPIIEAIDISAEVMNNSVYKKSLKRVCSQIERGVPLSAQLEKSENFPIIISQMISVGEKTGQLENVLHNLATFYEEESDNRIRAITSLFEPVIIVIIGLGVFFLVFSIIKPIYDIAQLG